ncbi:MAG: hypothetical protein ACRC6V_07040 [Bacteroidales bacterium]
MSFGAQALSIPSLGTSSSYDEFRTSSGMSCRQSVSGGAQLQIGGIASKDDSDDMYQGTNWSNRNYARDEKGIFMQLVVPLGVADRIDCTTLYNIEVEKQNLELRQLKAQIEMLQKQAALAGLGSLPEL